MSALTNSASKLGNPNAVLLIENVARDGILQNQHNNVSRSVKTYNNNQYGAFYNSARQIVLGKRAIWPTVGNWSFSTLSSKTITAEDDTHDYISIGFDHQGYLWIAYGMHVSAMQIFRMDAPESIATAQSNETTLVSAGNESTMSYPMFFNDANGYLVYGFRKGGSGNGDFYLYKYTGTWAGAPGTGSNGLFMQFATSKSPYVSFPFVKKGRMYVQFIKRGPSSAESDNHDVCYFEYDMSSGSAYKSNGTAQTLPVTDANADVVDNVAVNNGLETAYNVSRQQLVVDSVNNKYMVYAKNDANSNRQLYFRKLAHNATSWTAATQLTNEPVPNARILENHFRPLLLNDVFNTVYCIFKPTGSPGSLSVIEISENGTLFNRPYTLVAGSLGRSGLQNMDYALWDSKNILIALFQNVGAAADDDYQTDYANNSRYVRLFEWRPLEGARAPALPTDGLYGESDVFVQSENGDVLLVAGGPESDGNPGVVEARSTNSTALLVRNVSQKTTSPNKMVILRSQPDGITISNLSYVVVEQPKTDLSGSVTKAAGLDFDGAAIGTHKATASGTTLATPGTVSGGIRIKVNGTYYIIPIYPEAALT